MRIPLVIADLGALCVVIAALARIAKLRGDRVLLEGNAVDHLRGEIVL